MRKLILALLMVTPLQLQAFVEDENSDLRIDVDREMAEAHADVSEAQAAQQQFEREKRMRIQERKKLQDSIAAANAMEKKAQETRARTVQEIRQSQILGREYQKQIQAAELRIAAAQKQIKEDEYKAGQTAKFRDEIRDQRDKIEHETRNLEDQARDAHSKALEAEADLRRAQLELKDAIFRRKKMQAELAHVKARSAERVEVSQTQMTQIRGRLQRFNSLGQR